MASFDAGTPLWSQPPMPSPPRDEAELVARARALSGCAIDELARASGFRVDGAPVSTKGKVGELIERALRGELRLPEMQRRFVWTSTRVRDLLDSLYRGYPSGTILVWETDLEQASRDLAVEQERSPFTTYKLLLDGQQRLTSLSAVLRGEPIKVRNRRRPIDIAFNIEHPERAPIEIVEVEDDEQNPRYENEEALEDDADLEENESILTERLNKRIFSVASKQILARSN